jgi:hypothetical protein
VQETKVENPVLPACRWVASQAEHVTIDTDAVSTVARQWVAEGFVPPRWDPQFHFLGSPVHTAQFMFVVDTLNFCFWGEPKWRIRYRGRWLDGYWALAASISRAIEDGLPILDACFLSQISDQTVAWVFRGDGSLPLLEQRTANLREAGRWLMGRYEGWFHNFVEDASRNALSIALRLGEEVTSYRDVALYKGVQIPLLKRAQLCAADLCGIFGGKLYGSLADVTKLTAFADYKLPQMLRALGILRYSQDLAEKVDNLVPLSAGSQQEVEIRASTVWAVELLRQHLAVLGLEVTAVDIDYHLWYLSQSRELQSRPYHRTLTIFY